VRCGGVALLSEDWPDAVERVARMVRRWKQRDDLIVLSIHWGPNWGHAIAPAERRFAHRLIDEALDREREGAARLPVQRVNRSRSRRPTLGGGARSAGAPPGSAWDRLARLPGTVGMSYAMPDAH
jgi:hypothetical protein